MSGQNKVNQNHRAMIDQEEEHRQMQLEAEIEKHFTALRELLRHSDRVKAKTAFDLLTQAEAEWDAEGK